MNGLLVLARVFRARDQDRLVVHVDGDDGVGSAAVPVGVGLEAGTVDDREVGRESGQAFRIGTAQQVTDEQRVPSQFRHDPHVQAVRGVCAAEQVLHVVVATLHVLQHVGLELPEGVRLHRGIVFPPNRVLDRWSADDEFVLGRAAGVLAGRDQQRATAPQLALARRQGRFHQLRLAQVIPHVAQPADTLRLKGVIGVHAAVGHGVHPYYCCAAGAPEVRIVITNPSHG